MEGTGRLDRVLPLPGARVSYAEAGTPDGPVVFYLHGTPGSRMQVLDPVGAAAEELGLRLVAPDRPGYGGSMFARYRVSDYPAMLAQLADALGIARFGVVGTSGGARYAYACGALLPERVTRVALVAGTAPEDLPGVRRSWSRQDRQLYALATRAPWLLRVAMARTARRLRERPDRMLGMLRGLSPSDQRAVADPQVRRIIAAMTGEAFAQGGRGLVHDLGLEARPWGLQLGPAAPPVDIWHGLDDAVVRPAQARAVSAAVPGAALHLLEDEGHMSLVMLRSRDYLAAFG